MSQNPKPFWFLMVENFMAGAAFHRFSLDHFTPFPWLGHPAIFFMEKSAGKPLKEPFKRERPIEF